MHICLPVVHELGNRGLLSGGIRSKSNLNQSVYGGLTWIFEQVQILDPANTFFTEVQKCVERFLELIF